MATSSGKPSSRKFQAPKGTRDFYPQDMAVRRYIEGVWRKVSINHGFDEIEGPMFEDIDLYTHKSGPGIVSEIFQVFSGTDEKELAAIRAGGGAPFALRPEFTPTLARMVAAKGPELPRPIKWFAIPQHFRAERPQRGRLREFLQWNVDFIDDSPKPIAGKFPNLPHIGGEYRTKFVPQAKADAEVLCVALMALQSFGLTPREAVVYYTDRSVVDFIFARLGVPNERRGSFADLLDRRAKLTHTEAWHSLGILGLDVDMFDRFDTVAADIEEQMQSHFYEGIDKADSDVEAYIQSEVDLHEAQIGFENLYFLQSCIRNAGLTEWCRCDHSIVRGLAYYTGTVFEIHETTGAERAIAGGGRYDNLIESFGGPSLPACGFGMGDVVLANILHDKGLLPEEVYMKPLRPHAFAIAASDEAEPVMRKTVAQLRRDGFHIRHSYKTTRNVGKLLGEASKSRAMSAIIFGKELAENRVEFKDLQSGEQTTIALAELKERLKQLIANHA